MSSKKLLHKLADFFDLDAREKAKKKEEMSEVLSRLKQKEVALKEKLEQETDEEERGRLRQKIDLVHTQRKKGVSVLQELANRETP